MCVYACSGEPYCRASPKSQICGRQYAVACVHAKDSDLGLQPKQSPASAAVRAASSLADEEHEMICCNCSGKAGTSLRSSCWHRGATAALSTQRSAQRANLELAAVVVQDVGGLQVAVQHPVVVQVLDGVKQLEHQRLCLRKWVQTDVKQQSRRIFCVNVSAAVTDQ